jgi:CheY-like chemotaxis protein
MATILVVDDEPSVRMMVTKFLAGEAHLILESADGAAALVQLSSQHVDLVVTDLYMPEMDGIEFTRRLRQLVSRPAMIAMSGGGLGSQVDLLDIAVHLGAVATLTKPFTRDQLLGAVRRALSNEEAV